MSKGNLFTIPSTGVEIVVFPRSMTGEMMMATDTNPPPDPPVVTVNLAGHVKQVQNSADPNYLEAYKIWDNLLQFDVMKRIAYSIAIEQELTEERQERVNRIRQAYGPNGRLPESDHILWFFRCAIGTDSDIIAVAKACSQLADPQEERISEKADKF